MNPRTGARTQKSYERLQFVAKRLAAIVRFIHTGAMSAGRRFLAACEESQQAKAAAVIQKYWHLVDEAEAHRLKEALENCGRPAHQNNEAECSSTTRNSGRVACLPY